MKDIVLKMNNLDLPKELYVYIFVLADDLNSTKALRSVSKTSYNASYDYFKVILREPIIIAYNEAHWYLYDTRTDSCSERILKDVKNKIPDHCFQIAIDRGRIEGVMAFKTTIKEFMLI
jgi:hypothetical protein